MEYNKNVSCTACGAIAQKFFSVKDINQNMTIGEFDYYRCNTCKLIFIDQIPENLSQFYGSNYSAYQQPDFLKNIHIVEQEKGKLDVVRKYATGKAMLEIGPGSGAFAYFAKNDGYDVDVIEMDKNCCDYLTDVIGVNMAIHSLDIPVAIEQLPKKYDVIVLWHVVEHLINPWQVLDAISGILAPEGVLIIATPNPKSLQFKVFQKYWKHVDAPRHLSLIPMSLLKSKAAEVGLQLVKLTTTDRPSTMFHSYGWWMESLKNYQVEKPKSIIAFIFRNPHIKYWLTLAMYKLIFGPLERKEGNGVAYTAIFAKK